MGWFLVARPETVSKARSLSCYVQEVWQRCQIHLLDKLMTQSLPQPPAVDADEIISDFASWDLPGDLDNWFLVIDTIQTADTPRLRETAAQIRTHLESAKAKLKVLERQWLEPDMLWLL